MHVEPREAHEKINKTSQKSCCSYGFDVFTPLRGPSSNLFDDVPELLDITNLMKTLCFTDCAGIFASGKGCAGLCGVVRGVVRATS